MRENIYVCLDAHIITPLPPSYFSERRGESRNETRRIEVGNKGEVRGTFERFRWAHHNVSFHRWSDRWVTEFYGERRVDLRGGAWKLTADPAPSGGIHSCTFQHHNSRTGGISRIPGRYGIIYWDFPFFSLSFYSPSLSLPFLNGRSIWHLWILLNFFVLTRRWFLSDFWIFFNNSWQSLYLDTESLNILKV